MAKHIIFECSGGIGKSIMASAVIEAIKKQHPDYSIIVLTSHPAALINNPNIHTIVPHGSPNTYETYIKDHQVIFMCQEPYKSHGYLAQDRHLIKSWCDCVGVNYNNEMPKIYLTPLEIETMQRSINLPKPILMIQPFGGGNSKISYNWNRDLPVHQAQKIVDTLKDKYSIMQVCGKDQPKLNNVTYFTVTNIREIFSLMLFSKSRLFIDSVCQHAAAAFKLPSTVCWITNKPTVFGYNLHNNILPSAPVNTNITKIDASIMEYDFGGTRHYDYPYTTTDVFNIEEIITSIYAQL